MGFALEDAVAWGRSFDEYRAMFSLGEAELDSRIVGCADGPAGFNARASSLGTEVVSCDPLYRFSASAIRDRIAASSGKVLQQTRANAHQFVWDSFGSVDELASSRHRAMDEFLEDFSAGRSQGRYVNAELPSLPFADGSFGLALCPHFLFLYSEQLDAVFHLRAITELCRVASEVRVYPLVTLGGELSPYIGPVMKRAKELGWVASLDQVEYEFQRGARQMMRIWKPET